MKRRKSGPRRAPQEVFMPETKDEGRYGVIFVALKTVFSTKLNSMRPKFSNVLRLFALSGLTLFLFSFTLMLNEEFGKAAYYADALHGRKTASGDLYDKTAFTCSHKSLPFGTRVRVSRLDNNKSVEVVVNDRGPYKEGYVVDLSRRAAEAIDLVRDGVTRVKVEVVAAVEQPAAVSAPAPSAPAGTVKTVAAGKVPIATVRPATTTAASQTTVAESQRPATYSTTATTARAVPQPVQQAPTLTARATGPTTAPNAPKLQSKSASTTKAQAPHTTSLYKVDLKKGNKEGFGVQISTLSDANNLLPTLSKLEKNWPGKTLVLADTDELAQTTVYKIVIGAFPDRKAAEAQQKQIAKKGYPQCFVIDLKN
jgi:rare lipoprotein A